MFSDKIKDSNPGFTENFTDLYKSFFLNYPIVISANLTFSMLPSIADMVGGFAILQKLPSKLYLGIKLTDNPGVFINKIYVYDSLQKNFISKSLNDITNRDISGIVKKILEKENFHKGLEISLLSEKGNKFSLYSNIVSILAVGLFLVIGKLKDEQSDLINLDDLLCEIQNAGSEIYGPGLSQNKKSNPYNIKVATTKTEEPIILFPQSSSKYNPNHVQKLSNFFDSKKTNKSDFGLDIVILNSGNISYEYDNIKNKKEGFIKYTNRKIEAHKGKINKCNPLISIPSAEVLDNSLLNLVLSHKLLTLSAFGDLSENPFDYYNLDRIIERYKDWSSFFMLIEKQTNTINDIQFLINKNKSYYEENIAVIPFSTLEMGGTVMILAPKHKSRSTIEKGLNELKDFKKYQISLDYISWKEGVGGDTVKVEQNLYKQFRSKLVKQDVVLAKTLGGSESVETYSSLFEKYKKGIILDLINKCIFVAGEKVGSDEIFSQNYTIGFFDKLVSEIENPVPNSELELSSYSKYKNQLVGKIIIPFQKLVKKTFGKELNISHKGSNHEFDIILRKSDLDIVIIKEHI